MKKGCLEAVVKMSDKITTVFNTVQTVKELGRWKIDYCKKKIDRKVDLSNEDHCGPCGNEAIIPLCKKKNHDKR